MAHLSGEDEGFAPGGAGDGGGWADYWTTNPHIVSLAAGAFAGTTSETLLFPLDCLKTRLQSRRGFYESGGFRGVYRGVGTAICAAAPASAIFFSTYEMSKAALTPYNQTNSVLGYCGIGLVSSVMGEMAAGVYRVPMDLVKQRQQAACQAQSFKELALGVRSTHGSVFFASYMASFMRDISHSSLQFPMYEYLKLALWRWQRTAPQDEELPTWQAAFCGSIAGIISAFFTTPLDLLRTRLNLRGITADKSKKKIRLSAFSLLAEEVADVYTHRGLRGFFAGGSCRAAWMGLGGFLFLGSFEFGKKRLVPCGAVSSVHGAGQVGGTGEGAAEGKGRDGAGGDGSEEPEVSMAQSVADVESQLPARGRQLGPEPPASVSLMAGLLAGVAVDVPLHPLDTVKTRMQATNGFAAAGGLHRLWSGLSAVLIVSVPGSALFFAVYEYARHFLERRVPLVLQDDRYAMGRDAVAASLADVSACVVRVPCEVLKQRMQAICPEGGSGLSFRQTVARVSQEGLRGFFAGFGATAMREVPFALIQMPLFEEVKHRHPWTADARQRGDTSQLGFIGMQAGFLAGSFAGVTTTPLDVAKTRIILTERPADRLGLLQMMCVIRRESGMRGLFCGFVPRAIHCGLGGALWLGAFEWSKLLLWRA